MDIYLNNSSTILTAKQLAALKLTAAQDISLLTTKGRGNTRDRNDGSQRKAQLQQTDSLRAQQMGLAEEEIVAARAQRMAVMGQAQRERALRLALERTSVMKSVEEQLALHAAQRRLQAEELDSWGRHVTESVQQHKCELERQRQDKLKQAELFRIALADQVQIRAAVKQGERDAKEVEASLIRAAAKQTEEKAAACAKAKIEATRRAAVAVQEANAVFRARDMERRREEAEQDARIRAHQEDLAAREAAADAKRAAERAARERASSTAHVSIKRANDGKAEADAAKAKAMYEAAVMADRREAAEKLQRARSAVIANRTALDEQVRFAREQSARLAASEAEVHRQERLLRAEQDAEERTRGLEAEARRREYIAGLEQSVAERSKRRVSSATTPADELRQRRLDIAAEERVVRDWKSRAAAELTASGAPPIVLHSLERLRGLHASSS